MRLQITHSSRYHYDTSPNYALQQLRLRPLSAAVQNVVEWHVSVEGGEIQLSHRDHYNNHTDLVSVYSGQTDVIVTAKGVVETYDRAGVFGSDAVRQPLWHFLQPSALTQPGAGVRGVVKSVAKLERNLETLHLLSQQVLAAVPYRLGATEADTKAEEALGIGCGVCQDHAHIFIAAARLLGFPARYISGYLMINDRIDQEATHAWAEAFIESLGWVGFDVSNQISPDERYVRLAAGRDADDVNPIKGIRLGDAREKMIVSLQVQQ